MVLLVVRCSVTVILNPAFISSENLLSIPSSLNFTVMGAVVLVGALADQILQKRSVRNIGRQANWPGNHHFRAPKEYQQACPSQIVHLAAR